MGNSSRKPMRKMTIISIVTICLVVGAIVSAFYAYRRFSENPENMIADIQESVSLAITNLRHTATRQGKTEWQLTAARAHSRKGDKTAVLEDLEVVFFLDDGGRITLTAGSGVLRTDTNEIDVTEDVVLKSERYQLKTAHLRYEHGDRIIKAMAPVEITGESVILTADSMNYDLNARRVTLEGRVDGTLTKRIEL